MARIRPGHFRGSFRGRVIRSATSLNTIIEGTNLPAQLTLIRTLCTFGGFVGSICPQDLLMESGYTASSWTMENTTTQGFGFATGQPDPIPSLLFDPASKSERSDFVGASGSSAITTVS